MFCIWFGLKKFCLNWVLFVGLKLNRLLEEVWDIFFLFCDWCFGVIEIWDFLGLNVLWGLGMFMLFMEGNMFLVFVLCFLGIIKFFGNKDLLNCGILKKEFVLFGLILFVLIEDVDFINCWGVFWRCWVFLKLFVLNEWFCVVWKFLKWWCLLLLIFGLICCCFWIKWGFWRLGSLFWFFIVWWLLNDCCFWWFCVIFCCLWFGFWLELLLLFCCYWFYWWLFGNWLFWKLFFICCMIDLCGGCCFELWNYVCCFCCLFVFICCLNLCVFNCCFWLLFGGGFDCWWFFNCFWCIFWNVCCFGCCLFNSCCFGCCLFNRCCVGCCLFNNCCFELFFFFVVLGVDYV